MSAGVVWRRGHGAIRVSLAPIGLALQISTVTTCAVLRVNFGATGHLLRVIGICGFVSQSRGH